MEKKFIITQETICQIVEWSHSYGRSEQFNIGLFGADAPQRKGFTVEDAVSYINQHITSNLSEA